MKETVDRLVEVARALNFAIAIDPFADIDKPALTASLYGSVQAALDMAHSMDSPRSGDEAEETEWDNAARNGYVAAMREVPVTSEEIKGAVFHKLLLLQAHRLFDLVATMDSMPSFAATAAIALASSLLEFQYNNITGHQEDNAEVRTRLMELSSQLGAALKTIFPVQS